MRRGGCNLNERPGIFLPGRLFLRLALPVEDGISDGADGARIGKNDCANEQE